MRIVELKMAVWMVIHFMLLMYLKTPILSVIFIILPTAPFMAINGMIKTQMRIEIMKRNCFPAGLLIYINGMERLLIKLRLNQC